MTWFVRHEVVVRVENNPLTCDVEKDPLTTGLHLPHGGAAAERDVCHCPSPAPPCGQVQALVSVPLIVVFLLPRSSRLFCSSSRVFSALVFALVLSCLVFLVSFLSARRSFLVR